MALILQVFQSLLRKAYAYAVSLQSRSLSRDTKLNKCSTDLLEQVLCLLQRAWYSALQSNFNASCLVCKAGELLIWVKMQNVDCMQLAGFPEFWTGASQRPDRFSVSLKGACGCWRQLSHFSEPFRRGWGEKVLFSHKVTDAIG